MKSARDFLNRMEVPNAQNYSSGELGELVGVAQPADEALRKDAERYRWLRDDFIVTRLDIDANEYWVYRRNSSFRGHSLNEAIDAAMNSTPKVPT